MDASSRIERLEIRLTEQEATIEDLNRAVTDQWQRIDRLARQIQGLRDQMDEAAARSAPGMPEPPPPHY